MPQMSSLLTDCVNKRILNAQAAGTGAVSPQSVSSAPVDVSDCEAFEIIVLVGAIVTNGTCAFKLQHGDASDGSDLADVEGSALAGFVAADANKMWVSEVIRPRKPYINPVLTRATANVTIDGVIIKKYGMRGDRPVTQDATVKASKQLGSPASGTP